MIKLLFLILFPVTLFSQQFLRPDGVITAGWTENNHTLINEVTPDDGNFCFQEDEGFYGFNVTVREGTTILGSSFPILMDYWLTFSVTFNTPTNYDNLSIRFSIEDDVGLKILQVTTSNPAVMPQAGTNTLRYRAMHGLLMGGNIYGTAVSWAELEVPGGASITKPMMIIMEE